MGDIYLEPMLLKLRSNRGYVSAIFALLESITLISGTKSFDLMFKLFFFALYRFFSTHFNRFYEYIWISSNYDCRSYSSFHWILSQPMANKCLLLLFYYWYHRRYDYFNQLLNSCHICTGIGCGLIYLPAIVSVGYYFERKRSFAMGIAECGSGFGTFAFPFFMPWLIDRIFHNDYNGGLLLESGFIFTCVMFGLLMVINEYSFDNIHEK